MCSQILRIRTQATLRDRLSTTLSFLVTMYAMLHDWLFTLIWGHFFIAFREQGRERERQDRNINPLPLHTRPDRRWHVQPGHVPWLGIQLETLSSIGRRSTQLTGQNAWLSFSFFFFFSFFLSFFFLKDEMCSQWHSFFSFFLFLKILFIYF